MALLGDIDVAGSAQKRESYRLKNVSARLTAREAERLDALAAARGRARGELIREMILAEIEKESALKADPVLAEIVGVRLLLVNLLGPLASGQEPLTEPHLQAVFDQVKKAKHQVALDIQRGAK